MAIRVVGVSSIVVVGISLTAVVGVAVSAVAVGDGSEVDTPVDNIVDTTESDSVVVKLAAIGMVAVGRIVLMVGDRSKSKSSTTLPLEHITNIPSTTLREGLVSAEYSSNVLESPQSNRFPERWLPHNTKIKQISSFCSR